MTREEAIEIFEQKGWWIAQKETFTSKQAEEIIKLNDAANFALTALRPASREQVEKVWPECDCCEIPCDNCKSAYKWDTHGLADECVVCRKSEYKNYTPESQFCEFCGRPLTDEAVQMVMERLEALYDTSN